MNAASSAMWESVPVRELPTIPEFDYYNADDEDEEDHSARYHNHFEAASESAAAETRALNAAAREVAANSVHCSATAKLLARLSNTDLAFEWSMLCQDCTDCWSQHGKPNK